MRHLDELYATGDTNADDLGSQYTRDLLKKYQLSNDEFQKVFDYCTKRRVTALCTPFDLVSVDVLERMNVVATTFMRSRTSTLTKSKGVHNAVTRRFVQ